MSHVPVIQTGTLFMPFRGLEAGRAGLVQARLLDRPPSYRPASRGEPLIHVELNKISYLHTVCLYLSPKTCMLHRASHMSCGPSVVHCSIDSLLKPVLKICLWQSGSTPSWSGSASLRRSSPPDSASSWRTVPPPGRSRRCRCPLSARGSTIYSPRWAAEHILLNPHLHPLPSHPSSISNSDWRLCPRVYALHR